MAFPAGSKLGPYEILAPIGTGGMGEVYRAKDSRLQRIVAIKVLPADFAGISDRLLRFQQEARSASAFNHPNIVTIYGKYVSVGLFKRTLNETSCSLQVVKMEDGAHFELQPRIANSLIAGSGGRARWMPGGKQVAYIYQNEQCAWGVYVQDFIPGQNTSHSRKPLVGFDHDSPTESFGISPDGSRITICQREESSDLVLAENSPLE